MAATPIPIATKDNANSTLASGISAATTSIPLNSGGGASFPQPYSGATTSGGTATTLNCTGISATVGGSAVVGKFIWNRTDGSIGVITAVATNAITTTSLLGGADNLFENGDTWVIDAFVLSLEKHDSATPYNVTQREEVLITGRSTDTLTAASSADRGYNGTVAATFASSDYAYLHVTSPIVERFKDLVSVLAQQIDTHSTSISNLQTGSWFYVVTSGSANAYVAASPAVTLAAGNIVLMNANFTNTGSATLALNGQTAKTIKKLNGATNLASGDIPSGAVAMLIYDGTNFQMLSLLGNVPASSTNYAKVVYLSGTSSTTLTNPTTDTAFDTHSYPIPANDLASGVGYEFEVTFTGALAVTSYNIGVQLGSTSLAKVALQAATGSFRGFLVGTAAAGASVAVRSGIVGESSSVTSGDVGGNYISANVATNGTLTLQFFCKFSSTNAGNNMTLTTAKITRVSTTAS